MAFVPDIGRCAACGVFFRSRRPTQAAIQSSYDTGVQYESWELERAPREQSWRRRLALVQRWRAGGRLLDVGTGNGDFLDAAARGGFHGVGTELSRTAAELAAAKGHQVHVGQFTEFELPRAAFDVVTLWHVLEHVPDPGRVLQQVYAVLKPGGIFAVAVPNEENDLVWRRLGRRAGTPPFGAQQFGGEVHLTHFQPATFKAALRRAGFALEAFGVDNVYLRTTARNRAVLKMQQALSRITGWHFSMAMYAIGSKPS